MNRILIVEDNLIFRQSLKELLAFHFPSMSVDEAAEAHEALTKLVSSVPDLMITDIRLPGINGLELTRRVKSNHEHVEVIILTSHDLPEYREAAFRNGARHFLTKGAATSDDIAEVIESILSSGPRGGCPREWSGPL